MVVGRKSSMSRITKISGILAAVMTLSIGSAYAAESKCGALPPLPDLPADGATVASKDMDAIAKTFDAYQAKFADFNKCAVNEFNAVQKKFDDVVEAYSAKNSKKK